MRMVGTLARGSNANALFRASSHTVRIVCVAVGSSGASASVAVAPPAASATVCPSAALEAAPVSLGVAGGGSDGLAAETRTGATLGAALEAEASLAAEVAAATTTLSACVVVVDASGGAVTRSLRERALSRPGRSLVAVPLSSAESRQPPNLHTTSLSGDGRGLDDSEAAAAAAIEAAAARA